jgi:hypothetical protein
MSAARRLGLIGLGYGLAVAGGAAAVAVNEAFMPEDAAQGSPGMVAFGDMILFILATGVLGLAPTWLLLRLALAKAPRALLAGELLLGALGPPSWLAVMLLAGAPGASPPPPLPDVVGPLIAFAAIPRIVAGPVLLVVEGVSMLLARGRATRALLAAAMLLDAVPLSLFALHLARAMRY